MFLQSQCSMADCSGLLVSSQTSSKQCVIQCLNNYRTCVCSWQHSECDGSFGFLQNTDGLLMSDSIQTLSVNSDDLIPALQTPVICRGPLNTHTHQIIMHLAVLWHQWMYTLTALYLAEDGFDVDGKVTVRTAESTHDTEAQSVRPSLQTNALTLRRTGQNTSKQWH